MCKNFGKGQTVPKCHIMPLELVIVVVIIKALSQQCWGLLMNFVSPLLSILSQILISVSLLHIYFYYLHLSPLRPTPSPWRAMYSQTFPYRRRCRPALDMPKLSQTGALQLTMKIWAAILLYLRAMIWTTLKPSK